jgi:hypothetical protein
VSEFFLPDYVPTPEAIRRAIEYWVRLAAGSGTEVPEPELPELADIVRQTADWLRLHLYEKRVTAYFFGDGLWKGRHAVDHDFWATEGALGVLCEGRYFPFGRGRSYEPKPSYPLLLLEADLHALLTTEQQSAKKVPLPASKKAKLAKALDQFDDLPRRAQRKAVSELPEFQKYHITDDDFREAAKAAPRKAGRKRKRD